MGKVINFPKKAPETDQDQSWCGEAFCIQCGAEWMDVAQTGIVQLECPECKTMKGLLKFPFHFQEGALVRQCNCGNQLFYLSPEGHLCANCGIYQQYD